MSIAASASERGAERAGSFSPSGTVEDQDEHAMLDQIDADRDGK